MGIVVLGQLSADASEPLVEHVLGPRVERREPSDHARLALREHQLGHRDDEHRRSDDGQGEPLVRERVG